MCTRLFLCSPVCLDPVSPECDCSVSRNVRLNVLVCVYVSGKEQRQAQIADMCSFLSLRGEGQRNADLGRPCERSDSQRDRQRRRRL